MSKCFDVVAIATCASPAGYWYKMKGTGISESLLIFLDVRNALTVLNYIADGAEAAGWVDQYPNLIPAPTRRVRGKVSLEGSTCAS